MTAPRSFALLVALAVLQVFLPMVWRGFGTIDWLLILVVLQSLRQPFQRSVLQGAAAGLLQDGLSGGVLGLHAFAKTSVAAIVSSFGSLLVVRGPAPEATVVAVASLVEGAIVGGWQLMLGRPVSLGPLDILVRALATAATASLLMGVARWWQRRGLRQGQGRRRR